MAILTRGYREPPARCAEGQPRHEMQREVRKHPLRRGDWLQDRLVCGGCGHVMYDWEGAFKPNPQAGPNGHDGVPA